MIVITVEGEPLDQRSYKNIVEEEAYKAIGMDIIARAGDIVCETHGTTPSIDIQGGPLENLNFSISGCCEAVITRVKERFA